ncbi:MAG: hypothetical protein KA288_10355 [Paludibacteraceae bacterium]|jgi:hypothetical protein|nr:hypothetical protein [Paludibacteraceae bacterium]
MIFSTPDQIQRIASILYSYARLPFVSNNIPGAIMESVLATVRDAEVLDTYDFIDVLNKDTKIGWQVKSTQASTPVTWKRAKITNSSTLINDSLSSPEACQILGDAIIKFCNDHAQHSLDVYNLEEIGYSRLILHKNNKATYFEKKLCDKNSPLIFKSEDYYWEWSIPKQTDKKEQLPSFKGIRKLDNKKVWAWHGLGENQLHFTAEKEWWLPAGHINRIDFDMPADIQKFTLEQILEMLENGSN